MQLVGCVGRLYSRRRRITRRICSCRRFSLLQFSLPSFELPFPLILLVVLARVLFPGAIRTLSLILFRTRHLLCGASLFFLTFLSLSLLDKDGNKPASACASNGDGINW